MPILAEARAYMDAYRDAEGAMINVRRATGAVEYIVTETASGRQRILSNKKALSAYQSIMDSR